MLSFRYLQQFRVVVDVAVVQKLVDELDLRVVQTVELVVVVVFIDVERLEFGEYCDADNHLNREKCALYRDVKVEG